MMGRGDWELRCAGRTPSQDSGSNVEIGVYVKNVENVRKAVRSVGVPLTPSDVEDIVQDVFLKLLGELRANRFSPDDDLGAYAAAVARNAAYDFMRRLSRLRKRNVYGVDPMVVAEDEPERDEQQLSCVETCVSELSNETRTLYRARFALGMSQTEAGNHLGISRQTVRTRENHLKRAVFRAISDLARR